MGREAKRKQEAASAEKAAHSEESGQEASASGKGAAKAPATPKSRTSAELSRRAGLLVCTAVLVIVSVVALVVPGWGISLGTLLGGGNQVTLTATAPDGSAPSAADVASARANLQKRADGLDQKGVEVVQAGDDALTVRVPAAYDAASVASSISSAGKVELVRIDAISDADALAQIQAGTTDVQLAEGTYTAFASSDNVTDARVVTSSSSYTTSTSGNSVVYAVGLTLDSGAAQTLADVTDELSSSYGRIAVVVDGKVVTAPSVSSKIEGGQVTFSGGFTRDEAYALASELSAGPISVTLSAADPEALAPAFGGNAVVASCVALVVVALVCGLVCSRVFGRGGWLVALSMVVTVVLQLGVLTVLARFDYVILGTPELACACVAAVVALVSSVVALARYRSERASGASVRKAQQDACELGLNRVALVEAVVCIVAIVACFFVPSSFSELTWALSAGLLADLVSMPLLKAPMLRVLTAADAEAPVVASSAEAAAKSGE